jgi:archaellum biogenesis ATPase FlaH
MANIDINKIEYYVDAAIKCRTYDDYHEWINRLIELADLGEAGRDLAHRLSATSSKYSDEDCDKTYSDILKNRRGDRTVASFVRHCTDELHIPKYKVSSTKHSGFSANTSSENPPTAADAPGSLLDVRTANEFMIQAMKRPIPKKLFRELWYEGELCILFADTNAGKSILAVQIGEELNEPVLYCDFELSDKQFQTRYTNDITGSIYTFPPTFYRAEINPDSELPDGYTFEEFLNQSLEAEIKKTGIRILIIDNITYLRSQTEKAHEALPLMKSLKRLKAKYNLSILCLAHTPKRDMTKPITRNDLQGSKMLINFCDSSFAIGESQQEKSARYIKQIKTRNSEFIYDADNVISCQITKQDNFLRFEVMGFGSESDHLMQLSEKQKEQRMTDVIELKRSGLSNVDIAKRFGVSETAVRKWLKKAEDRTTSNPSNPSNFGSNGSNSSNQFEDEKEKCPF